MKKSYFLLFLFVFAIFLICPKEVEAKTECEYVLEYEATDSVTGEDVVLPYTFILETEDDDSKLTKVTLLKQSLAPVDVKFANGKGLDLNDDGTCPNIVVYDQAVMGGYKIYKTMKTCRDGLFTLNDRCYELTGRFRDTSSSASDQTGTGSQYRASLSDSSDDSCSYIHTFEGFNGNVITNTITVDKKGDNDADGSCDIYLATSCRLTVDVPGDFYDSNNQFFCPAYIYITSDAGGRDASDYRLTLYDTGTESDEDRSGPQNEEENWQELGDQVTLEDFTTTIYCEDIFGQEEGELGWLLNLILGYIRVIGPILVVLLSAIDFIKAVVGTDEKAMKEAQSKLVIRLICAVGLFLVPTLVQVLLSFINQTACSLS
mgnify:CR=1 FL=1